MKTSLSYLIVGLLLCSAACTKDNIGPEKMYELGKQELNISYGSDPRQIMDVYFPEGYNEQTPVVFLIHGGGFIAGSKEDFTPVAKLFVAKGFISVNLSHRLVNATGLDAQPPLHQASTVRVSHQVEDVASAVEKFKTSAVSWSAGTSRLYMAGHSAGGTLAMLYVQGNKNDGVRASGNLAGLANVTLKEELYNNPPAHEHWPAVKELLFRMSGAEVSQTTALALMAISPNWVTTNNKPGKANITVMSASNDRDLQFYPYFNTVRDAEDYHKQLSAYGTSSAYVLMDTDHGFGNHPDDWAKAVTHVAAFFRKN
jgi:acetyl esterase/lipase